MKERLINNLGLKILSIFVAVLVWLAVVNVSNPEVTRMKEVTLEIENEQILLAANRTFEVSGKGTVTVAYDVHTRDEYKIRPTDFRAYIDLSELYDVTGSVPVKVEVLNNKELVNNVVAKPGVTRVETEDLQRKQFQVKANLLGKAGNGYGPDGVKLSPEYVTVEGPMSRVGQITSAGIDIDISGLTAGKEATELLKFYDANGKELEQDERVHVDTDQIGYQLTINKVQELNLEFRASGTAAEGYQFRGVVCDRKTVAVIGDRSGLDSVSSITVTGPELGVDGLTEDKEVTVDLRKFLPEGVRIIENEPTSVTVVLDVERLETKAFTLRSTDIEMTGGTSDLNYRIVPDIEVTLRGLKEDLDGMQSRDLRASVSVAGMKAGTHAGTLKIEDNSRFKVMSISEFQVEATQKFASVLSETTSAGGQDGEGQTAGDGQDTAAEETTSGEEAAD